MSASILFDATDSRPVSTPLPIALALIGALLGALIPRPAAGHGTPIEVHVQEDRLLVSHEPNAFTPITFAEDDEDGEPLGAITHPALGPLLIWELPGLDIYDMLATSSLSLEVLASPAGAYSPRVLWYWDPQSQSIEGSPSTLHLLGTSMRYESLEPGAAVAPAAFTLADPVEGQTGFHNHGLLAYALAGGDNAAKGAYAFMARLSSDAYGPSDPFLVVLNHGVEPSMMVAAAEVIQGAAIPGDFDRSGAVDAADYELWRAEFGAAPELAGLGADGNFDGLVNAADYTIWRDQFTPAPAAPATTIPEPAPLTLVLLAAALAGSRRSTRYSFRR